MSEHPRHTLALRTRTRLLGTLNLAVAIGGRSSGWGRGTRTGKPRRWFVGHHRNAQAPYHRAIELVFDDRRLVHLPLGSGPAKSRRAEPVVPDINAPMHVVPAEGTDLVSHTLADDCVCGPRMEPVKRDDGSVGWICTHHSLDGREFTEADR